MADPMRISGLSQPQGADGSTRITRTGRDLAFSEVLKSRLEAGTGVTFSAHALSRLTERGISLGTDEKARLSDAVSKAGAKGAAESLILLDDKAFIVSIRNSTVVTAMSGDAIKGNVFTNIDSTIIA